MKFLEFKNKEKALKEITEVEKQKALIVKFETQFINLVFGLGLLHIVVCFSRTDEKYKQHYIIYNKYKRRIK